MPVNREQRLPVAQIGDPPTEDPTVHLLHSGTMPKDKDETRAPTGPKGGVTTVSPSGMIRKSILLKPDEDEALRKMSFDQRRSEAAIIREALRSLLKLPDNRR